MGQHPERGACFIGNIGRHNLYCLLKTCEGVARILRQRLWDGGTWREREGGSIYNDNHKGTRDYEMGYRETLFNYP